MPDLDLTPPKIRVKVPTLEVTQVAVPSVPGIAVVPVVGPVGPEGPPGPDTGEALEEHILDPEPHPAYDDIPSLTIIFENGLF